MNNNNSNILSNLTSGETTVDSTAEMELKKLHQKKLHQKESIYKWRNNNHDKYNELMRKHNLNYYYRNKEKILEKKKAQYHRNKSVVVV